MQCVAVPGQGFIPGAYKCVCRDGFYFSETHLPQDQKYFNGSALEGMFLGRTENISEEKLKEFQCLPCAEGCDTCVDDSPCLYAYILPLRVALLALCIILVLLIVVTSAMIAIFRNKRVRG